MVVTIQTNHKLKYYLAIGKITLYVILPIVILILPSTFFDNGKTVCLSVLLFDIKCLGCGMTRAIQHLIHFDFSGAYQFNKLSFIVLPLLIYVFVAEILKQIKSLRKLKLKMQNEKQ